MSGVVGTEPEPGSQDHMGLPPLHVQRVISPEKQRGAGPTWTEPEPPREPSRFWDFASFWSRAHLISQVPCFSGMPESDIRLLTSALTDQQFAPGDVIVVQGEPADSMFVVVNGEVAVCAKEGGTASIAGSLLSGSSPASERGPEVDADGMKRSRSDELALFGDAEAPGSPPPPGPARGSISRPSSASRRPSEGSARDSGIGAVGDGTAEEVELARMRRGYFSGETSVLEPTYRAATVRAVSECHVMWLTREAFAHFVRRARTGREEVEEETTGSHLSRLPFIQQLSRPQSPADEGAACKYAEPFETVDAPESRAGDCAPDGPVPRAQPQTGGRDSGVASTIAAAFAGSEAEGEAGAGAPLAPELMLLSSLFEKRTFQPGEEICREGEAASTFFVITEGVVRITVRGSDGEPTLLNSLRRSDCFGEIGLVLNTTRTATATACVVTTVLTLDRQPFNKFLIVVPPLCARITSLIRYRTTNFLRTIDLFSVVSEDRRSLLGDLFQFRSYAPHTAIYRQDDLADGFSILLQGSVEVLARGKDGVSNVFLARISPVTVLGEVALLAGSQRTATVSALREPVLVLHLAAHLFRKFVSVAPELRDYFAKIAKNRAKHSVALGTSMVSVPDFGDCGHASQCPRCRQHTQHRNLEVARLQEQVMELEGALTEAQAASLRLRRQTGRLVSMVRRLAHPAPQPVRARFRSAVHRLVAARRGGRAEVSPLRAVQGSGSGMSAPSSRGKRASVSSGPASLGSDLDEVVDATELALGDESLPTSGDAGDHKVSSPYAGAAGATSPAGPSSRRARTINALVPPGEEETGRARGAGTVARLEEEGGLGPGPAPSGAPAMRAAPAGGGPPPADGPGISRRVPIVRTPSDEGRRAAGSIPSREGKPQWGVLRRIAAAAASLTHRRRRNGRAQASQAPPASPGGGIAVEGPPSKWSASPRGGAVPAPDARLGGGADERALPREQSAESGGEEEGEEAATAAPHFRPSLTPPTETTRESEGGSLPADSRTR